MPWNVRLSDVAARRDTLIGQVEATAWSFDLESLGRAHRWLGEKEQASRRFRQAAAIAEEEYGQAISGAPADTLSRIGSLLWRAGELELASSWLRSAAQLEQRPTHLAPIEYLLGNHARAVEAASFAVADPSELDPLMQGIEAIATARRDGVTERAAAARAEFVTVIRRDRTGPQRESGAPTLSLFDWLEETFRVQAELDGAAAPDHGEMLRVSGLAPSTGKPPSSL